MCDMKNPSILASGRPRRALAFDTLFRPLSIAKLACKRCESVPSCNSGNANDGWLREADVTETHGLEKHLFAVGLRRCT